ncbi:hypothetical protein [Burkholderia cenocepacia]|uniref:hypothetical protein n=1 Tax=Burkholderia cenocepacia TaxID=95486 RepID=UPI00123719AE|nr:hypothetical protein [Burkholderia cenocepacia]
MSKRQYAPGFQDRRSVREKNKGGVLVRGVGDDHSALQFRSRPQLLKLFVGWLAKTDAPRHFADHPGVAVLRALAKSSLSARLADPELHRLKLQ